MKKIYLFWFLWLTVSGCTDNKTKYFSLTDSEVINVGKEVIDFETEEIIAYPHLNIMGDYLIITDLKSVKEKGIFIFDKNSLELLARTGIMGQGPGEISRYGEIAITPEGDHFWMPDFEKIQIFKFNLDSIFSDESYLPSQSPPFQYDFFLSRLKFISEFQAIGTGVEVLSPGAFRTSLGKWDIIDNTIKKFGYEHPKLKNQRTNAYFDYSYENTFMALAHVNHDILTLYHPDGTLKLNIIGEKRFDNQNRTLEFFGQVHIGKNFIFTRYLGDKGVIINENLIPKSVQASKILAFDHQGNLIKIFETDHEIRYFAVDEKNERIYCFFMDRETPVGYFNVKMQP